MALGGACLLALALSGLWRGGMNSAPRAISILGSGAGALWLFLNASVYVHRYTRAYAGELEARGLKINHRRSLGMRFWYGFGPWVATRLVAAIKP
jgi:hypothetical protein